MGSQAVNRSWAVPCQPGAHLKSSSSDFQADPSQAFCLNCLKREARFTPEGEHQEPDEGFFILPELLLRQISPWTWADLKISSLQEGRQDPAFPKYFSFPELKIFPKGQIRIAHPNLLKCWANKVLLVSLSTFRHQRPSSRSFISSSISCLPHSIGTGHLLGKGCPIFTS